MESFTRLGIAFKAYSLSTSCCVVWTHSAALLQESWHLPFDNYVLSSTSCFGLSFLFSTKAQGWYIITVFSIMFARLLGLIVMLLSSVCLLLSVLCCSSLSALRDLLIYTSQSLASWLGCPSLSVLRHRVGISKTQCLFLRFSGHLHKSFGWLLSSARSSPCKKETDSLL